ncbi:hypothetical protein ABK040_007977 [Willaertia magna]
MNKSLLLKPTIIFRQKAAGACFTKSFSFCLNYKKYNNSSLLLSLKSNKVYNFHTSETLNEINPSGSEVFSEIKYQQTKELTSRLIELCKEKNIPLPLENEALLEAILLAKGFNKESTKLSLMGKSITLHCIADYLFSHFPNLSHDHLTMITYEFIKRRNLFEVAKDLGLDFLMKSSSALTLPLEANEEEGKGIEKAIKDQPLDATTKEFKDITEQFLDTSASLASSSATTVDDTMMTGGNSILNGEVDSVNELGLNIEKTNYESLLVYTIYRLAGALYYERGIAEVRKFVVKYILSQSVDITPLLQSFDPKSHLNQIVKTGEMHDYAYQTITYKEVKTTNSANRKFTINVFANDVCIGEGVGQSKKIAEQKAAQDALNKWYAFYNPAPTPLQKFTKK